MPGCLTVVPLLAVLLAFTRFETTVATTWPCETASTYYAGIASGDDVDVAALHSLLAGHRVIPYTASGETDAWDALTILDADPTNASNVIGIYTQGPIPVSSSGDSDGWNREHTWPKSLGVKTSGPDYSDLMALRASDWNVNAARNNLIYGDCAGCATPAHSEAATDTAKNSVEFRPPASVRGDLARGILYMAVRYTGDEDGTEPLTLSDSPFGDTEMGRLSDLLAWHAADPVSDAERARNDKICDTYQHNRNPFIDHPEWVSRIDWATLNHGNDTTDGSAEAGVAIGCVAVVGFASDAPDMVALVTLCDIPSGTQLRVTDNGWTAAGTWRDTEGVLTYSVGSELSAGTVLTWTDGETNLGWSESGSFSLSSSGDHIFVYLQEDDEPSPHFLFATSYTSSGFDADSTSSGTSALPAALATDYHITLPHSDNYVFNGNTSGLAASLRSGIQSVDAWTAIPSRGSFALPSWTWDVTAPAAPSPAPAPSTVPSPLPSPAPGLRGGDDDSDGGLQHNVAFLVAIVVGCLFIGIIVAVVVFIVVPWQRRRRRRFPGARAGQASVL